MKTENEIKVEIYAEIIKDLESDNANMEELYDKYINKSGALLDEWGKVI